MNNPKHESVSEDVERKRKHAERKAANVAADDFLNDPLNLFALSNPRDSFIAGWQARAAAVNPVQDNCHVCEKPMVDIYSAGKKRGCQDVTCKNSFGAAVKPVQNTAPLNGGTCSDVGLRPDVLTHGLTEVGEQNNCHGGVPKCPACNGVGWFVARSNEATKCNKCLGTGVSSTGNTEEREWEKCSTCGDSMITSPVSDKCIRCCAPLRRKAVTVSPPSPLSEEQAVEIMAVSWQGVLWETLSEKTKEQVRGVARTAYRALKEAKNAK